MSDAATTLGICRWCEEPVVAIEPRYQGEYLWHATCRHEALHELIHQCRQVR